MFCDYRVYFYVLKYLYVVFYVSLGVYGDWVFSDKVNVFLYVNFYFVRVKFLGEWKNLRWFIVCSCSNFYVYYLIGVYFWVNFIEISLK